MITILHGGQTGVDRGAHEAALDAGWRVSGYMPKDGRDELGAIPPAVARHLKPCPRSGYGARTEENLRSADALLVIVPDQDDPKGTPGTKKTLEYAAQRYLRRWIVEPNVNVWDLASWLRGMLHMQPHKQQPLAIEPSDRLADPITLRLMVAGPRQSKWRDARVETAGLLRRVAIEMTAIDAGTSEEQNRRMPRSAMSRAATRRGAQ